MTGWMVAGLPPYRRLKGGTSTKETFGNLRSRVSPSRLVGMAEGLGDVPPVSKTPEGGLRRELSRTVGGSKAWVFLQ